MNAPDRGGATGKSPMMKLIAECYNDMENLVILKEDQNLKIEGHRIDASNLMPYKTLEIINRKRLYSDDDDTIPQQGGIFYQRKRRNGREVKIPVAHKKSTMCNNIHQIKKVTDHDQPFPLKKGKNKGTLYENKNTAWVLRNKRLLDEAVRDNKITVRNYILRRGYESDKVTRDLRCMLPWLDKELITIQEMRMGKRNGKVWCQTKKKFVSTMCEHCNNNTINTLHHELLECPHTKIAVRMAVNQLQEFNIRHTLGANKIKNERPDVIRNLQRKIYDFMVKHSDNEAGIQYTYINQKVQQILFCNDYQTTSRLEHVINQLDPMINIEHLNSMQQHKPGAWEAHVMKIKTRVKKEYAFILDRDFLEIYRLKCYLIENAALAELWHHDPNVMINKITNVIKDEEALHRQLISPKGSTTQQTIFNMLLVYIIKYKNMLKPPPKRISF